MGESSLKKETDCGSDERLQFWSPAVECIIDYNSQLLPLEPPLHNDDYAKSITTSLQGIPFSIPSFLYKALPMKPFIKIYRQSSL